MTRMNRTIPLVVILLLTGFASAAFADFQDMIGEMITAFAQSSKGIQDEAFLAKVNEIDQHLREKMDKDHDLAPFKQLLDAANNLKARASARKMFEVVLEKAYKRLQFTNAQQEITDKDLKEEIASMIGTIERYLDPNLPDDDTVDRAALEKKRKSLREKIQKAHASIQKIPADKKISVQVTGEDGQPAKLSPAREANLLAKLKTVAHDPGKLGVQISLKKDDLMDIRVHVQEFIAPNGFAVVEGELDFAEVRLAALDDADPTSVTDVMGDEHFRTYRVVQNDEQLNVMPHGGSAAYEMGSMATGQTWKMEFKKPDGISAILKELEGNTEIGVLNAKTAVNDKAIELKNLGTRNLIYLQGTDITGLVSVKAVGFLTPKDGVVTFRDVLLVVDDQMSSDVTKFVGEQGINFFLKRASDNLRTGLPFTPVLENISCERNEEGKTVYIFSGRGKNKV